MPTKSEEQFEFPTLECELIAPAIFVIRLNRVDVSNAMNTQMARDLIALLSCLPVREPGVRCIVITGAGNRAFCAGGDLKERRRMTDAEWLAQHVIFEQMFRAVLDFPIPIIAAINGAAYGGGCELALACDFIYAADNATFAQTETRLGIIPGGGGTQTLPRAVGARRAKELIFTGDAFTAQQALEWRMINKIVAQRDLLSDVLIVAGRIAANAPIAVRSAKLAISNGSEVDLRSGLILEIAAYNQTVPTFDRREGIQAANERRPPRFIGE
jgi:enoyl-CoA hydratase/carnithine racemase